MSIPTRYPFHNIKAIEARLWIKGQPRTVIITARQLARSLTALSLANQNGVTALEMGTWAIRLAAYVHKLKSCYALDIHTARELHPGGWHARYILLTPVEILEVITD